MTVYVSHDNASGPIAKQVAASLKDKDITSYLKGSYRRYDDIARGIDVCKIFIYLGCNELEQDRLSRSELFAAFESDKFIFPASVKPGYVPTGYSGRLLDGLYVTDLSTETARQEQLPILVASIQALLAGQHH